MMPRIWADTIGAHRQRVQDAVLDATADLIAEQGPMSVTMSAIAERAGIGRATLYKYFADVESILGAWHARGFAEHLHRLEALVEADHLGLDDVTAFVSALRAGHLRHGPGLVGTLAHSLAGPQGPLGPGVGPEVIGVLTELLARLATSGEVRADLDPALLAHWLLHAVHAPTDLDDEAVAQLIRDSLASRP
jgi:AcrR family transcriptional regulator